ncbi:MAG: acetolactate decarboxylase [Planctomycetota bacterium]
MTPLNAAEAFQYSTTDTLLAGLFDGDATAGDALDKGDFGLGIFNGLDDELLVLDGAAYRLTADRTAVRADDDAGLPFYTVCTFDDAAAKPIDVEATAYDTFKAELDAKLDGLNYPHAIKIEGTFRRMIARSTHKEQKSYAPIGEVMERRVIMDFEDVSGVIVAFRMPSYLAGINTAGYHFHFISDDRTAGGHVMDFDIDAVTVKAMKLTNLDIALPDSHAFEAVDFSIDRSQDLKNAHRLDHGH